MRMCWEPEWAGGSNWANSCLQWDLIFSHLSCAIPFRSESVESPDTAPSGPAADQPSVIPTQGDLLGDLLNLDLGPPVSGPPMATVQMGAVDLLGGGLDILVRPSFCAPSLIPGCPVGIVLGLMLALFWAVMGQPGDMRAGPSLQWVRTEGTAPQFILPLSSGGVPPTTSWCLFSQFVWLFPLHVLCCRSGCSWGPLSDPQTAAGLGQDVPTPSLWGVPCARRFRGDSVSSWDCSASSGLASG